MASATLLLPARTKLVGSLSSNIKKALARVDVEHTASGVYAQILRHFRLEPNGWPIAALTRQLDVGDAAGACWLRADPAYLAPDMTGARLLAYGPTLGLTAEDNAALLPTLAPLFSDAGFVLDAPTPNRWYVRLPTEIPLPVFAEPEDVVGDDLFGHLPEGDAGRRWRALFTEVQVVLHQHPWNAARLAAGKPAVNALWFWGAGMLPTSVQTHYRQVRSPDAFMRALAKVAGISEQAEGELDALLDLRHLKSLESLSDDALTPLLEEMRGGQLERVVLDFQDGARFTFLPHQRWRFWHRAFTQLGT